VPGSLELHTLANAERDRGGAQFTIIAMFPTEILEATKALTRKD
jgi:hypothetical protein